MDWRRRSRARDWSRAGAGVSAAAIASATSSSPSGGRAATVVHWIGVSETSRRCISSRREGLPDQYERFLVAIEAAATSAAPRYARQRY